MDYNEIPIIEHITELKYRVIYVLMSLSMTLVICYIYGEELLYYIFSNDLDHLIYTNFIEPFIVYIKLASFVTICISIPYIMYQIWLFITPGLYKWEKELSIVLLIISLILLICALYISKKLLIPFTCQFFSGFEIEGMTKLAPIQLYFEARMSEVLPFVMRMTFLMILFSQWPLILGGLLHIIPLKVILRFRRITYFGIVVISTLITPPDVISQLILSIPLIIIYEISIIIYIVMKWIKLIIEV